MPRSTGMGELGRVAWALATVVLWGCGDGSTTEDGGAGPGEAIATDTGSAVFSGSGPSYGAAGPTGSGPADAASADTSTPNADATTSTVTDAGATPPDSNTEADTTGPVIEDIGDHQAPDGEKVTPWDDPDAQCGYGTVYGLICSVSEQTFVDGAKVWVETVDCDGNPLVVETESDEDGYYTLEGVPNGLQEVQIERDDFEKSYTVTVKAGKVTDVTGVGHKECFQYVDPDTCVPGKQNINVEAKVVGGVADIVWFIDTSGSMKEEAKYLQDNINAFASYIGNQAVDFHVILIAEGFDICVPEPLGGPGCTDGPTFRRVHESVDSHNGLEKIIDTYDKYADFLRPDATTNFIAVTDDNSDENASWFKGKVGGKTNPGFSDPFVFHSIVGMGQIPFVGCIGAASTGSVYIQLSDQTGGAKFPICTTDWSSIFGAMAETVVNTVKTTCGYAIPNPQALANTTSIHLKHNGGGAYMQVAGPEACGTTPAWYLEGQEKLFLCPSACGLITGGVLELSYSCD